ncbi:MAG TPA: hypothetical protein PKV86_03665, partial [Syntrophobacteraceae bacterium]|nr:hypothetical protein [Syntrophobacteraceae bacterium]
EYPVHAPTICLYDHIVNKLSRPPVDSVSARHTPTAVWVDTPVDITLDIRLDIFYITHCQHVIYGGH